MLVIIFLREVYTETRNTKDTCYGAVSPLSQGLARAANVPEGTLTCLGHRRSIEREDNRCSSPLPEKHSRKLTDIPASLYVVLNSRGENKENYCPGSKWCHACKRRFYKEAGTTDVNKRGKVNPISAFPFRESSFNMTRGWGEEDIETWSLKF